MKVRSHAVYIGIVGLALFVMFFGAYNLAFPLVMGQKIAFSSLPMAFVGSFLSFICLPMLGFYGMALYDGDYNEFFCRLGKILGMTILTLIMLFWGPFGALSRCINLSYPFMHDVFSSVPLPVYVLVFCFALFVAGMSRSHLVTILGRFLAPLLLLFVLALFVAAYFCSVDGSVAPPFRSHPFRFGFFSGYFSLAFLKGFLLCYLIMNGVKRISIHDQHLDKMMLMRNTLYSMLFAIVTLFVVMVGLTYTASKFAPILVGTTIESILPKMAQTIFGAQGPLVCFGIVFLTCFTAAVALAVLFSDFLRKDVFREKMSHPAALAVTLLLAYLVSVYEYVGIFYALAPLLYDLVPGLILLTLLNIGHKFHKVKLSKTATIILFIGTVLVFRSFV